MKERILLSSSIAGQHVFCLIFSPSLLRRGSQREAESASGNQTRSNPPQNPMTQKEKGEERYIGS